MEEGGGSRYRREVEVGGESFLFLFLVNEVYRFTRTRDNG